MLLTGLTAISEGHGDVALILLKAGALTDKRDVDGKLAIDMAPDAKVRVYLKLPQRARLKATIDSQVRHRAR